MSKRITDNEILFAVESLKDKKREEWYDRFGPDLTAIVDLRREEIQNEINEIYGKLYSDGGIRNRLKKLVELGKLTKTKTGPMTAFYK